jgi:hypothetical protein
MGTDVRVSPHPVPIAEDSGKMLTIRGPDECKERSPGEHVMAPGACICRLLLNQRGSQVAMEAEVGTDVITFSGLEEHFH